MTIESNKQHHDRAACFWLSDVSDAAEVLANAAMNYPPQDWISFVEGACRVAKIDLRKQTPTPTQPDGGDEA